MFIIRVKRELQRVYRNGCRYNERLNAVYVVYYESIKRELKIRCIYECRCVRGLFFFFFSPFFFPVSARVVRCRPPLESLAKRY